MNRQVSRIHWVTPCGTHMRVFLTYTANAVECFSCKTLLEHSWKDVIPLFAYQARTFFLPCTWFEVMFLSYQ